MQYNNIQRRNKPTNKYWLTGLKTLLILILIGLVCFGVYRTTFTSEPLKANINWQIDKTLPITQKTLEQSIKPLTDKLYLFNLNGIKRQLEINPWVSSAQIKRLSWGTIQIIVNARKIALYWQDKTCQDTNKKQNCKGYISKNGVLFIPKILLEADVATVISANNPNISKTLLNDYHHYQVIVEPKKIKFFIKSNIDTLIIKPNIKVILGYQEKQKRLSDFVKIYAKLKRTIARKKLNHATYDMRYKKGFSLTLPSKKNK